MTPYDIMKKAINFERPPRLPVQMGSLGVCDVAGLPRKWAGERPATRAEGEDHWGCIWEHTDVKNMGQIKGHPLEDIRDLDKLPRPDYTDDLWYVDCEAALQRAEADNKYVTASIFMVLFERMHGIYGFENTLVDLYNDRPGMEALADLIAEVHITYVKGVARRFPGRVHGWNMTDDWGTQQAAFVGYDMWMDLFYPRYKRIFDAMHETGCDVHVHSCGKINEIIEGYIQSGVDVVNLQQPRALGIEEIGERYRGRITFSSLADIQSTLPTGDRPRIREDVEALMAHWANADGGYILSDYGDSAAIGVPDEGVKPEMYAMFSELSEMMYGGPLPELPQTDPS